MTRKEWIREHYPEAIKKDFGEEFMDVRTAIRRFVVRISRFEKIHYACSIVTLHQQLASDAGTKKWR